MTSLRPLAFMFLAAAASLPPALPAAAQQSRQPLVIAHRGASGYRPEHTLAAYRLAIAMGADCIEPDLVMTSDGALVARHEPEIGMTTDAAAKFPDRTAKKNVDGTEVEGWFAEDFTLAELKTLRARQPRDDRASAWDGLYEVPTLQEVIELAKREGEARGRAVCLYPETKHPTYLAEQGLDIDAALAEALTEAGLAGADAPVFVQSFETTNLNRLNGMIEVKLVQLLDEASARPYDLAKAGDPRTYGDLMTPDGLRGIKAYADGIGPWKRSILTDATAGGAAGDETSLVRDAHAVGLLVHPYTFRDEPRHLAPGYAGDPEAEYLEFYRLGVDGLFSDFPDTALRARARLPEG